MYKKLRNGVEMPTVGLGVYKMIDPDEAINAIRNALDYGYRAIDTASYYENEEEVGKAIQESGIPREELFITTKVWNDEQGYDETLRAFERSLKRLDLEYIDLYLTHWPVPDKFIETYRAIERLYEEKLIRVPGVSNHSKNHLLMLEKTVNIMPMVNQVECHPYLQQKYLQWFCQERNIALTAYSPLGKGTLLEDKTIKKIANEYNLTPAQVILRWHLQNQRIIIPKSVTPSRIKENISVFDFKLDEEAMNQISALDRGGRIGHDPDLYEFI